MPPLVSHLALLHQPLALLLKIGAWFWAQRDVLLLLGVAFSPVLLASLLFDYGSAARRGRREASTPSLVPPPVSDAPEFFRPVSLFDDLRFY